MVFVECPSRELLEQATTMEKVAVFGNADRFCYLADGDIERPGPVAKTVSRVDFGPPVSASKNSVPGGSEPMLAKMAAKREAGYKALGYEVTKAAELFSRVTGLPARKSF